MKYPNFNLEQQLFKQGYKNIVGVDEAGRGAWAGPIVAMAAQIVNINENIFKQVRDSKKLLEKKRERLFDELSEMVIWSVGVVNNNQIDKIGIQAANILAMQKAVDGLSKKADYLLVDKVFKFNHQVEHQLIVKGDAKVISISVASVLAKVYRDRLMRRFHQKYPSYNFHKHKGYGTALHQKCLSENGICQIHRQSYQPIAKLVSSEQ